MDLITIVWTLISLGLLFLLAGVLIVGFFVLLYLMITGKRWD